MNIKKSWIVGIWLCLAGVAAALEIHFTAADGYENGLLVYHSEWDGHSALTVDSKNGVIENFSDWKRAFYVEPLSAGAEKYEVSVLFSFSEMQDKPEKKETFIGVEFLSSPQKNSTCIRADLSRLPNGKYQLSLGSNIAPRFYKTFPPVGSEGLLAASGLCLKLEMSREKNGSDWVVSGTLSDAKQGTGILAGTAEFPLDKSYKASSWYGAVNPCSDYAKVAERKVRAFSLSPLAAVQTGQCDLSPVFTDGMVLQRDQKVPVYGYAPEGTSVCVSFAGQVKKGWATEAGMWKVLLDPMKASAAERSMEVSFGDSGQSVELKDILVGDVWLCCGQSNMATTMDRYRTTLSGALAEMNNDQVRLIKLVPTASETPRDEPVVDRAFSSWRKLLPAYAKDFSAVGCFFGRTLQEKSGVPVGLIDASLGGVRISTYLPDEVLRGNEIYAPLLSPDYEAYDRKIDQNQNLIFAPSRLFNGTVAPLTSLAVAGVLYYQGESDVQWNGSNGLNPPHLIRLYPTALQDLIKSWCGLWNRELPFLLVQLPSFGVEPPSAKIQRWPMIREAQENVAERCPNVGFIVTTDLGEYEDIHPHNKQPVGERLGLLAACLPDSLPTQSPQKTNVRFDGNEVFVTFDKEGEGLQTREVRLNKNRALPAGEDPEAFVAPADQLEGFLVCGNDRTFHPADAEIISKNVVKVTSLEGIDPVAVRYNWQSFSLANLYNSDGFPAAPFRTDSYEY